jgi:hypothetical protein
VALKLRNLPFSPFCARQIESYEMRLLSLSAVILLSLLAAASFVYIFLGRGRHRCRWITNRDRQQHNLLFPSDLTVVTLTDSLIAMNPWHIHLLVVPSLQM